MIERKAGLPPESIKGLELFPDSLQSYFQEQDWKQKMSYGIGNTVRGRLRFLPAVNSKVEGWVAAEEKKRGFLDEINSKVDGVLIKSSIVKTSALAHERNLTVVEQILADEYAGVDKLVINGKDVFKASRKYKDDPNKALESKVRSLLKVYKKQQETGEVNFSTEVQEALKEITEEKKGLSKDKRALTRYKSEIKAWGKWYYYLNNQGKLDRMIENGMSEAEDLAPAELLGYRTISSKRPLVAKLYEFSQKTPAVKQEVTVEREDPKIDEDEVSEQVVEQAKKSRKASLLRKLAVAGISASMILAANFFVNASDLNLSTLEKVVKPTNSYQQSETLYASSEFGPIVVTTHTPTQTPHPGAKWALATMEAKFTAEAIPTETVTPTSTSTPEPITTPIVESITASDLTPEATAISDNALTEENLYREFMEYRRKQGLSMPAESPVLCRVAQQRLEDVRGDVSLLNHDKFSLRWYGLTQDYPEYIMGGENLARNTENAEATIEAWEKSPTHKKNLIGQYNQVCFATDGVTSVQILGYEIESAK